MLTPSYIGINSFTWTAPAGPTFTEYALDPQLTSNSSNGYLVSLSNPSTSTMTVAAESLRDRGVALSTTNSNTFSPGLTQQVYSGPAVTPLVLTITDSGGNTISASYTATPEPGMWPATLFALLLGGLGWRRFAGARG